MVIYETKIFQSKNSTSHCVIKTNEFKGKRATEIVEKLIAVIQITAQLNEEDPYRID